MLWSLALVSSVTVGLETALTRYFAVAGWSEYGYWVISIVLAGFALSGVALALTIETARRHAASVLSALPPLLVAAAALGYRLTTLNPFNPLALQNEATLGAELRHIAEYDAALLPFFFLAGTFVSLCFTMRPDQPGRVYAFDLAGAGAGSVAVLAAMFVLPPFRLVPALLVPLAAAAALAPRRRMLVVGVTLAVLGTAEAVLLLDDRAAMSEYKPIYAPLHTPDARVTATWLSPRGEYAVLDDFTERLDTDISNDAGSLGVPGPPRALGVYRDGVRIGALPGPPGLDVRYAPAALDALPYVLIPHARALVVGASGGFGPAAKLALGATHVDAVEPDPVLRDGMVRGLGGSLAPPPDPHVNVLSGGPLAAARAGAGYDVIDVSADFLDANEANAASFSAEAIRRYLAALAPGGVLSLPVSIRDFPVYASRVLATVREALGPNAAAHVLAYRSAWNVRVLVTRDKLPQSWIATARAWCSERSFDIVFYPGFDPETGRATIYNDLPAVSFTRGVVTSAGPDDAVADEAGTVLSGGRPPSADEFDLRPTTLDRPFFYAALDLERLRTIARRLELLPQPEIGAMVNVAVLAQAGALAALVLTLPLLAGRRLRAGPVGRAAVYFPALGLGFLFIEIFAIDRASFYLSDRASGFAIVLTAMLVFSGAGSFLASRHALSRATLAGALAVVIAWCVLARTALIPALLASLDWPWAARAAAVLAVLAPVSVALGTFFPVGLSRMSGGMLPWAWALNGAFSVVATPAANLLARVDGYDRVLVASGLLYGVAFAAFPAARRA